MYLDKKNTAETEKMYKKITSLFKYSTHTGHRREKDTTDCTVL